MDASCKIQRSIHDVRLTYKYVSRILGTYHILLSYASFIVMIFLIYLVCCLHTFYKMIASKIAQTIAAAKNTTISVATYPITRTVRRSLLSSGMCLLTSL